ncbi:Alpha/Beta hydrolase protein [Aspergillus carlsbadensis]|nr:Alpha/Beta hydrolase protein [Aspergillus carlsbadensis]
MLPGRMGVPENRLSGFEKFESPDPADWTARGYAMVHVDSRGSWDSEGYLCWAGGQEGRDGYDVIEFVAKLPWCNGNVATVGNSWLGRSQWYIAAERPPSLKCIAPLEGSGDLYREIHVRGGIACTPFLEWMMGNLRGRGRMEDPVAMLKKYPFINDYWKDKRAKVSRIQVPAYILASYSTFLHLPGSLRGFEEMPHDKKWLRVHDTQEWHDLYQDSTNAELQKFFDYYLKGVDNDWEETPKVRISLLGFNLPNIVNKQFTNWPVPDTSYLRLYLAPGMSLSTEPGKETESISYQADVDTEQMDEDPEQANFSYKFSKRTYLLGSIKATLFMSCNDADDMDIFLQVRKMDSSGQILRNYNIPMADMEAQGVSRDSVPLLNTYVYLGPHGQIRASHRAIDQTLSKPHYIQHEHLREDKIEKGKIVKIETSIWPGGIIFEEGERLVFKVSGHPMYLAEFPTLRGQFKAQNTGRHYIRIGGASGSFITVPLLDADE